MNNKEELKLALDRIYDAVDEMATAVGVFEAYRKGTLDESNFDADSLVEMMLRDADKAYSRWTEAYDALRRELGLVEQPQAAEA
jgi:hypothetical protein